MQPQVGELLLVQLKHEVLGKAITIARDLLIQAFGGLAVERGQVGVEQHPVAANRLNALGVSPMDSGVAAAAVDLGSADCTAMQASRKLIHANSVYVPGPPMRQDD